MWSDAFVAPGAPLCVPVGIRSVHAPLIIVAITQVKLRTPIFLSTKLCLGQDDMPSTCDLAQEGLQHEETAPEACALTLHLVAHRADALGYKTLRTGDTLSRSC